METLRFVWKKLIYTFWYINIPDVTTTYEMPFDFIVFLGIFTYNLRNLLQTFTIYVYNYCTNFRISQHVRCDCKIWNVLWFYYVFYKVFCEISHIIENHSCLKCYIFTKHSQNICLIDTYNLVFRYIRCNCRLWKVN